MDERTLGGTEFRGDLYKIICSNLNETRTRLHLVPGYAELNHANRIRMLKSRANFYDVLELMAFPVVTRQYMQNKINPVHRPVIEELMADLQSLLDAMPQEEIAAEAPEEQVQQPHEGPYQLQRISDGVVFDVLGTKTEPSFVDAVFLTYAEGSLAGKMFGFGRAVLESEFTAYPPQEEPKSEGMFHNA